MAGELHNERTFGAGVDGGCEGAGGKLSLREGDFRVNQDSINPVNGAPVKKIGFLQ